MLADDLAARLRGEGYRVTGARLRVFEALQDSGAHLTADELADRLGSGTQGDRVTLSSVYRALAVLEELGLARASRLSDDEVSHWELAHPDEHFHVVCRMCGNVDHHRGSLVQVIDEHLREGHGFAPDEITVLVRGLCAGCQS
ncbi:MAG: Fur family ferric uptake transcriptional regulator [Nitriliruptoraceae bacterium]